MVPTGIRHGLQLLLCAWLLACGDSSADDRDAGNPGARSDAASAGRSADGGGGRGVSDNDARTPAAGAGEDASVTRDGSAEAGRDAAAPDALPEIGDPTCADGRFEVVEACVPTGAAAGGAIEVQLRGSCDCGGDFLGCAVSYSTEDELQRIVNLFPRCARCDDADAECSAADEAQTTCKVEGLPAGRYEFRLDNLTAGRTVVGDAAAGDAPCFDPRATEGATCSTGPLAFEEHCGHSRLPAAGRAYFEFAVPCGACQLDSIPCDVQLAEDRIDIEVTGRTCLCDTCGECEPQCYRTVSGCLTPPLAAGSYRVFANGSELQRLEVGDGEPETSCNSAAKP